MLLSLVDVLRCPRDHEETALVLSVDTWKGVRVERGTLGCPVCRSRYPIVDCAVDFRVDRVQREQHNAPSSESPSDPMRLIAQLGLSEPGGLLLLTGFYAALAAALIDQIETTCLIVDGVSVVREAAVPFQLDDRIPLVASVLRGAAVDEPRASPGFLRELARTVRAGGRIVSPGSAEPPGAVRILARDAREWVGEVEAAAVVVPLRRHSSR